MGQFSEALSMFHGSLPTFSEMHAVTYPAGMHARAYAFKIKHASWMPEGVKLQFARITRPVRLFLNLHPAKKADCFFFLSANLFRGKIISREKKKKILRFDRSRPVTDAASIINQGGGVKVFVKVYNKTTV